MNLFNRITKSNFILGCLIVLLHANCLDLTQEGSVAAKTISFTSTIADIAVPIFFMISGMLFLEILI